MKQHIFVTFSVYNLKISFYEYAYLCVCVGGGWEEENFPNHFSQCRERKKGLSSASRIMPKVKVTPNNSCFKDTVSERNEFLAYHISNGIKMVLGNLSQDFW